MKIRLIFDKNYLIKIALVFVLSACSAQQTLNPATTTPESGAPLLPATISKTPSPPALAEPEIKIETATPTLVPSATPTLFPLSIDAMRARQYPGSDMVIEQELTPAANYKRYIASYKSDGLKIFGLLTIPTGTKPATGWPVIIFNHGFIPPKQYVTTERYVAYVDMLARNGYIVFKSDYRGHGNSEGVSEGAYGHPDYVIDVLNAMASVKRLPDADPNRIGMWGHSMGGYITLRAMVISREIKAGVIWGGVVAPYPDLLTKWTKGPGAEPRPTDVGTPWHQSLSQLFGSPDQNPQLWASISANSFLSEISGPLQLHVGLADVEVPVSFSENLFTQMLQAGKYVELYKYPGDNHNISNNFNTAMQRSVDFFDRFVKNP
jgi:dipeptidyl aminopeptidase/acylaminoacyl peptidase